MRASMDGAREGNGTHKGRADSSSPGGGDLRLEMENYICERVREDRGGGGGRE